VLKLAHLGHGVNLTAASPRRGRGLACPLCNAEHPARARGSPRQRPPQLKITVRPAPGAVPRSLLAGAGQMGNRVPDNWGTTGRTDGESVCRAPAPRRVSSLRRSSRPRFRPLRTSPRRTSSAGTVDPAIHEPVANFVEGGWGRRRVARESRDHLMRAVQILFSRRGPVDLRVKQ